MKITLPLPPSGTNHIYKIGQGRMYKDKKATSWEQDCLWLLKRKIDPVKSDVAVSIEFYFGNKRKNDIDGRIKPVLDILQKAGCYEDDSLITELQVLKRYDKENPRCEVEVI